MTYAGERVILDADSHVMELADFLDGHIDPGPRLGCAAAAWRPSRVSWTQRRPRPKLGTPIRQKRPWLRNGS